MDIMLTAQELRVLGSLLEKEMATPEYYPLTLNSLMAACNQKTSRLPVVSYDEKTVLSALAGLKNKRLVWESVVGRVPKYEQSFLRNNKLINTEAAVLCVLMLRGPQTAGEIRAHTQRLYDFKEPEKLDETLSDLMDAGYVMRLPRQPGQKEVRLVTLLCGVPETADDEPDAQMLEDSPAVQSQEERIASLEEELRLLRRELDDLRLIMQRFMEQFK